MPIWEIRVENSLPSICSRRQIPIFIWNGQCGYWILAVAARGC